MTEGHGDKALRELGAKLATAEADAAMWKRQYELFANVWLRELGGKVVRKSHLIDALAQTTAEIVAKAAERETGLPREVEAWRLAEKAAWDAQAAYTDRMRMLMELDLPANPTTGMLEYHRKEEAAYLARQALHAMSAALGCQGSLQVPGVELPGAGDGTTDA